MMIIDRITEIVYRKFSIKIIRALFLYLSSKKEKEKKLIVDTPKNKLITLHGSLLSDGAQALLSPLKICKPISPTNIYIYIYRNMLFMLNQTSILT